MSTRITIAAALAAGILTTGFARVEAGDAEAATSAAALQRPAQFALVDAAPSIDVLIARLLDALAKNDRAALDRLRVTEDEYRRFLLPGGGEPGKPPRVYNDEASAFAWQLLNTHSTYAADGIIKGHGGHHYTLKEVTYLKGQKQYAWYTAYRTVALAVEDESGKPSEIVLGSIADVDGQFKFVSLYGDR